jgi:cell wall-associated NlpC family hydrolase
MKKLVISIIIAAGTLAAAAQVLPPRPAATTETSVTPLYWNTVKSAIDQHLSRPYVWGATGLKSFDCSGFVWRVMADSGVLLKRTTARKLYMSLKPVGKNNEFTPGNIVFFDDLKHCGIVEDKGHFYHAESTVGTNRSQFNSYWRPKVFGFRVNPLSAGPSA